MLDNAKELAEYARYLEIKPQGPFQPSPLHLKDAEEDIPVILKDVPERDPYLPVGNPCVPAAVIATNDLIFRLAQRGHDRQVAAWAVFRHIKLGFLGAEVARIFVPKTTDPPGSRERRTRRPAHSKKGNQPEDVIDPTKMIRETVGLAEIPISRKPGAIYLPIDGKDSTGQDSRAEAGDYREFAYLVVWSTQSLWDWWERSCPATTSSTQEALTDGPVPPNRFRFGKETVAISRPLAWKLVHFLWHARYRTCNFADVAEPVWNDHAAKVDKNMVRSVQRDANNVFKAQEWPFRISVSGETITLIDKRSEH